MKYMTKPFEIEAVHWTGTKESLDEVFAFMADEMSKEPDGWLKGVGSTISHVWDHLQKVWVPVNEGDYIIRGMKGEYYPCNADVFEAKYEEVRAPSPEDIEDAINTIRVAITSIRSDMADQNLYGRGRIETLQDEQRALEDSQGES